MRTVHLPPSTHRGALLKMTSGRYEGETAADEVIQKFVFSTLSRNNHNHQQQQQQPPQQQSNPVEELEILIPDVSLHIRHTN